MAKMHEQEHFVSNCITKMAKNFESACNLLLGNQLACQRVNGSTLIAEKLCLVM